MKLQTQHITPIHFKVDSKDKLVSTTTPILYDLTPNRTKGFKVNPQFITIHYTAAPSFQRCVSGFLDSSRKRSAQLVIARDGEDERHPIACLGAFTMRLWHAGKSRYRHDGKLYKHFNGLGPGIEIQNFGKLNEKHGDCFTWFGKKVAAADVYEHDDGTYWHSYTSKQIDYVHEICATLIAHYPIKQIVGHSELRASKIDPGPAFPLDKLREDLLT